MGDIRSQLDRFTRRVAILKSIRGLAWGTLVGSVVALIWVLLDYTRVFYSQLSWLLILVATFGVAGAVIGFARKAGNDDIAKSIDSRTHSKDLAISAMRLGQDQPLAGNVRQSAEAYLTSLSPKAVFPFRWHVQYLLSVISIVVVISLFLLGNSPIIRGPKSKSEREELQNLGATVQKVARPLEQKIQQGQATADQKKMAQSLSKMSQELEQGKLNKEEAMRRVNELAKKAEDDAKNAGQRATEEAKQAETALSKYTKFQMEDKGIQDSDLQNLKMDALEQAMLQKEMQEQGFQNPPSNFSDQQLKDMGIDRTTEQLSQLSPEQRKQLADSLEQQKQELQKEIDRLDKLPEAERKAAEQRRQEMQKQMEQFQKMADKIKMSEETMKALKELMQSQEMKDLQQQLQKMQQAAKQMEQTGKAPTEEELKQMQQRMEQLANAMKDPAMKQQMKDAIKQMTESMKNGQMNQQAMQQIMSAMKMGQPNEQSPSATDGGMFQGEGSVNKSQHEMETKGKTTPGKVNGQWREEGQEWSMTIKAPSQVGNKSSVPYQSVMQQYKNVAEKALSGGKIPKGQEKRVKEYFDSLSGGKKS